MQGRSTASTLQVLLYAFPLPLPFMSSSSYAYSSLNSFPDVTLGFSSSEYTVSESDGLVNVTVMTIGVSAVPISISLSTTNGDATGELMLGKLVF